MLRGKLPLALQRQFRALAFFPTSAKALDYAASHSDFKRPWKLIELGVGSKTVFFAAPLEFAIQVCEHIGSARVIGTLGAEAKEGR